MRIEKGNKKMTYKELGEKIKKMTPEQLQQDVTIKTTICHAYNDIDEEYEPIKGLETADKINGAEGILDRGHPFLT